MTISDKIKQIWDFLCLGWEIISKTRFSLLIVGIAALALMFNAQVKDLLVGVGDRPYQVVLFFFAVTWWSMQSWGWARYILDKEYGVSRGQNNMEKWLVNHLPRIYGVLSVLVAAWSAFSSNILYIALGLLALALMLYVFYAQRHKLVGILPQAIENRMNGRMYLLTYIVLLIFAVFAVVDPVTMGNLLGPGAVVFLALGSFVPIGTLLVEKSLKVGFPVIMFMVLLIVLFSFVNDNHHVRMLKNTSGEYQQAKPAIKLDEAYRNWKQQADADQPLVLVASSGGGLRATYWTDVVLGELQETLPDFHRQVFAFSGVSGGSLGGVFYTAALRANSHCLEKNTRIDCFSKESLLQAVGQDYLSPVAAAMLYGDMFQRFWPMPPAVSWLQFADRAQALEQAWEQGFERIYSSSDVQLSQSFRSLYEQQNEVDKPLWLPMLFLNGTAQETGQRIITSPVEIDSKIFLDSYDFYALNGHKAIAASTAAHNSARFTYVSPAGTFGQTTGTKGHIIDGGYFENYGAVTLLEVLNYLIQYGLYSNDRKLIVIMISNDLQLPGEMYGLEQPSCMGKGVDCDYTGKSSNFLNETIAPLVGMLKVRQAHGMLAYKMLAKQVGAMGEAEIYHFSLAKLPEDENQLKDPPLGWVLSEASMENMRQQLFQGNNKKGLEAIKSAFNLE